MNYIFNEIFHSGANSYKLYLYEGDEEQGKSYKMPGSYEINTKVFERLKPITKYKIVLFTVNDDGKLSSPSKDIIEWTCKKFFIKY